MQSQGSSAGTDLNVDANGQVVRVYSGTYDTAELKAESSGSIHVLGDLTINDKLQITADHSATVLIPFKVTCDDLEVTSEYSSNVNSDDLEATSSFKLTVEKASTASLHLVLSCPITGSITESSTANLWIHWPNGKQPIDLNVDGGSVLQVRDWSGVH